LHRGGELQSSFVIFLFGIFWISSFLSFSVTEKHQLQTKPIGSDKIVRDEFSATN
jgi:hypothetical protein